MRPIIINKSPEAGRLSIPMRGYEAVNAVDALIAAMLSIPMRGYEEYKVTEFGNTESVLSIPMRGYESKA